MVLKKDPLLSGPLGEKDLADNKARERYLAEVDGTSTNDALADEDVEKEKLVGVVGLEPVTVESSLLDYQRELVKKIVELCSCSPPDNIGLVALPTGAGKTRTAVCAVLQLIHLRLAGKVLWLAPSRELLEQAVSTFQALWPSSGIRVTGLDLLRCDVLKGFPKVLREAVYFSTPQMLYKRLISAKPKLPIWDLVVFDEAHLAGAPTFRDALTLARELGGTEVPCFGLSATPGRSDEPGTDSLIGLFKRRLLTSRLLGKDVFGALRDRGVLAHVKFNTIPDEGRALLSHKDAATSVSRFRATTFLCRQLSSSTGSTLVFAGSVRHAIALAASLQYQGVPAAWISGAMSSRQRERTIKAFEAGAYSVLINKSLLATGYDCPAISNVVLTVPIRSAILFEQMTGRAARGPRVGGNERATIWYFDDHIKWHGEPSSYRRYALSGWR